MPMMCRCLILPLLFLFSRPLFSRVFGLSYGPFRGLGPDQGETINETQILQDMEIISSDLHANAIRTYGTALGQSLIPTIASEYGVDTWVGAWISGNSQNDADEVDNACSFAPEIVIVGNEYVFGQSDKNASITYLRPLWEYVRSQHHKTVAYADASPTWIAYPHMSLYVDYAIIHSYSFWDGTCTLSSFATKVLNDFKHAVSSLPPEAQHKAILGETGWPSSGCDPALCTPENQKLFFETLIGLLEDEGLTSFFLFEAFDEAWKGEGSFCGGSSFAKHWGVVDGQRELKVAGERVGELLSAWERKLESGLGELRLSRYLVLGVLLMIGYFIDGYIDWP